MPESKYYDKYISNHINTACNESICISHSLSETSNWYNDYHTMVNEIYPWMLRGGDHYNYNLANIFGFYLQTGGSYVSRSFRLIIAPIT